MSNFFGNLDTFRFFAADLHRHIPIDPGRLQMLVKRHYPASEAAQQVANGKRQYTPRMVIWLAVTNELMNLGVAVGAASKFGAFSFFSLNDQFAKLASGDLAQKREVMSWIAVLLNSQSHGKDPSFILEKRDGFDVATPTIVFPIFSFLDRIATRFEREHSEASVKS